MTRPQPIAFAGNYSAEGTGVSRYQRELLESFDGHRGEQGGLALFTPYNRSLRPAGLPEGIRHLLSPLFGKLQQRANQSLGMPIERIVPGLADHALIHSLHPDHIRTRLPWLVTIHDVAWRHFGPEYAAVFPRSMQRSAEACIRQADHLLAVSRFTADCLVEGGVPASRITVVYQGIDPALSVPPADAGDELSGLDLPERYMLYVGTCHPRKNLPLIARAYAEPGGEALPPCLLVGPPPEQGSLAELGVDGQRLRHLGYLSDAQLALLLRGATALVFPSLYEGFGRPLIEAMALGLPVLASAIPVFEEVAGEAALFFPPEGAEAPAALARQLQAVSGDAALAAELRRRGPLQAARFSWERCCSELDALYTSLIGG